jgi:hypothetical protein
MMKKNKFEDFFKEVEKVKEEVEQVEAQTRQSATDFWSSLSKEDQMKAFFMVTSKLYDAEVNKKLSYRGVLYEEFGFDRSSYVLGMQSNFIDLHNMIKENGNPFKPLFILTVNSSKIPTSAEQLTIIRHTLLKNLSGFSVLIVSESRPESDEHYWFKFVMREQILPDDEQ